MQLVFEWDKNKAQLNLRKHKVSFEEAKSLFNDPLLLTYSDEVHSNTGERYISIGMSNRSRILIVIHADRKEAENPITIRIISCRRTTASERQQYEEGHEKT
jgi:uncharacterized DUF497 family protein